MNNSACLKGILALKNGFFFEAEFFNKCGDNVEYDVLYDAT